jgi:hypothetical protein
MRAVETTKEKWCDAEVHRMAGEIALKFPEPDATKAQGHFERALPVTDAVEKSWELRTATCLGAALARSGQAGPGPQSSRADL